MRKEEKKQIEIGPSKTAQRQHIRDNTLLMLEWRKAHKNNEIFIFGLLGQDHALHVRPGTTSYLILADLIAAEIDQAGKDLIQLAV